MENKKKEIKKELFGLFYNLHDSQKHIDLTNKIKRNIRKSQIAVDTLMIIPKDKGGYCDKDCESMCFEELSKFIGTVALYREYLTQVKNDMIFDIGELVDKLGDGRVETIYHDMKEKIILFLTSLNKKIEEFLTSLNNLMVKTLINEESSIYVLRESQIGFAEHIVKGLDDINERLSSDCLELTDILTDALNKSTK